MSEQVTLTMREQQRLQVLNELEAKRISHSQAATLIGVSERQVYRLKAAYRAGGAGGLVHGNRGRASPLRLPEAVRQQVVELLRSEFSDFNDHHLTDILNDEYEVRISRSSVRRLRQEAGLPGPRKRRSPKHRSRRERYPRRGMLLQIDGSDHAWLETRGPELTLISAIDDATGEIPFALFRPSEDAAGYFLLLQTIGQRHGLPLAVYADRHTIFQSPAKASIEQQLAGERPRTQFGRLLDQLEVTLIPSYSPEARGRVERLFGTLQDRLVKELRRAHACSLLEANQALAAFLPVFNARFSQPPADPQSAYRPWPEDLPVEAHFCFKHQRSVRKDSTISFDGHQLAIPPNRQRTSYAPCRVEVRQQLDGRLTVWHHDHLLASFEPDEPGPPHVGEFAPAATTQARPVPNTKPSRKTPKTKGGQPWKPPADHPWRRPFLLKPGSSAKPH